MTLYKYINKHKRIFWLKFKSDFVEVLVGVMVLRRLTCWKKHFALSALSKSTGLVCVVGDSKAILSRSTVYKLRRSAPFRWTLQWSIAFRRAEVRFGVKKKKTLKKEYIICKDTSFFGINVIVMSQRNEEKKNLIKIIWKIIKFMLFYLELFQEPKWRWIKGLWASNSYLLSNCRCFYSFHVFNVIEQLRFQYHFILGVESTISHVHIFQVINVCNEFDQFFTESLRET